MSLAAATRSEGKKTEAAPRPTPTTDAHPIDETAGASAGTPLFLGVQLHRRLAIGSANDPLEREADQASEQVLEQVLRSSAHPAQRKCTCGDRACEECRKRREQPPTPPAIRRKAVSHESGPSAPGSQAPPIVHQALRSPGRPLDPPTRSFMEQGFGRDFSEVRVHTDPLAGASARAINALAYASGTDVVFASGQFQPQSTQGMRLLAHELAHVAGNHAGLRRRSDIEAWAQEEAMEQRRREWEAEQQRHQAWSGAVQSQHPHDLASQSGTVGEERERIELALTAQRAQAMDEAAAGQGWLRDAMQNAGYDGPLLPEIRQLWAEAMVAAEAVKLGVSTGTVTPDARLSALSAIPGFYNAAGPFAQAAEAAHKTYAEAENDRREAAYQSAWAQYQERERLDRMSQGYGGEPGETAFRGAQALMRGSPPPPPEQVKTPPVISGDIPPANDRVYSAEDIGQWQAVATDLNRVANGVIALVVASLPATSDVRRGMEHLEGLDARLAALEQTNPNAVRLAAVFYPKDQTVKDSGDGQSPLQAQAIPWQFYLINTGVTNPDQPAHSGGEWVLIDLTSMQRFENRQPAGDFESALLQQGEAVDPPASLFEELNSKIRFPEGQLYIKLPSGKDYTLETTEPWSLSDWLTSVGIALAAIALVASVVATGGASAPAAVAFYAGLGAAAAGVGSTLANLHELSQQGILTSQDVDKAMISIAIDVIMAASMGLGRLVALPEAAARMGLTGERFIALQRLTQVARAGVVAGDVYQAWSMTAGVLSALRSIDEQPDLTPEERDRMRGQIARRALLTGALLTLALKGDVGEFRAGSQLRISHVDPDGALVVAHAGEPTPHEPEPHETTEPTDPTDPAASAHAAPHAEVTGPVHAGSERSGASLTLGPQSHAVGAAGTGRFRDLYFCSDRCSTLVDRLQAVLGALPRNHPMAEAVKDMLGRARRASRRLKLGELDQAAADAVANELSSRIERLGADSEHFNALMNADPAMLAAHAPQIRQRLALAMEDRVAILGAQGERQAASRSIPGRDPLAEPEPGSALEGDLLGEFGIRDVPKPGGRPQPLRFDTGNFSHTHAEALVPGLPRGMNAEVTVTRLDGTVGRADRVQFIRDAEGDIIGANVYEVKPNTAENIQKGERQVQEYVDGIRAKIENDLRAQGKAVPTTAPGGGPLYSGHVVTYNQEEMIAVMRAIRGGRLTPAQLAEYEAVARQVFAAAPAR